MKSETIHIRLDEKLRVKIIELAKKDNRTVSNMIETILKKSIYNYDGEEQFKRLSTPNLEVTGKKKHYMNGLEIYSPPMCRVVNQGINQLNINNDEKHTK
jgi:hypothetical protein